MLCVKLLLIVKKDNLFKSRSGTGHRSTNNKKGRGQKQKARCVKLTQRHLHPTRRHSDGKTLSTGLTCFPSNDGAAGASSHGASPAGLGPGERDARRLGERPTCRSDNLGVQSPGDTEPGRGDGDSKAPGDGRTAILSPAPLLFDCSCWAAADDRKTGARGEPDRERELAASSPSTQPPPLVDRAPAC